MQSRNTERQEVGICTVARSSTDSSVEVPMKSKERQAQASFRSQLIRLCCRRKVQARLLVSAVAVESANAGTWVQVCKLVVHRRRHM